MKYTYISICVRKCAHGVTVGQNLTFDFTSPNGAGDVRVG
jgi:hypothetical protein